MSRDQQLHFIDESLAVCLDLLNDSLEFCRGNIQLQMVEGFCRKLLDKHLEMLRLKLESDNVQLVVDIPDSLIAVFDPARLARVIFNLAKNAGEAVRGQADATVTIAANAADGGTSLSVSDNGPGMPPEAMAKLFQPFGTHGKRGGTGFGLAIAKQLVDGPSGEHRRHLQPGGNHVHYFPTTSA